jgi:hypothetical protein
MKAIVSNVRSAKGEHQKVLLVESVNTREDCGIGGGSHTFSAGEHGFFVALENKQAVAGSGYIDFIMTRSEVVALRDILGKVLDDMGPEKDRPTAFNHRSAKK